MRKTDKDYQEKLDYYNHIDEHNVFKGIVKFPTIQSLKLANVLCKNEEIAQKYLNEYYNPEFEYGYEIINSLQKFRKDIINKRNDVSEYKDKIKNCIDNKDWKTLWNVLQDLFLEPLAWTHVLDIVEKIHNGIDENDIMKWYERGRNILAIATHKVEYIKGIK